MTMIRLYVPGPLATGAVIELGAAQTHYLQRVMRRSEGDPVELFDGEHGGFSGRIAAVSKRAIRIEVLACIRELRDPESGPVLFQAVIKRPRLEWLVEKATELGAGAVVLVRTRHVVASSRRTERLATIAIEAAEQSGRLEVPAIVPETPLAEIGSLRRPGRRLLVLDPWAEVGARQLVSELAGDVDLLVGPEGGLAPEDDAVLARLDDVVRARIAPTILRAETAALAGLSACAMSRVAGSTDQPDPMLETC